MSSLTFHKMLSLFLTDNIRNPLIYIYRLRLSQVTSYVIFCLLHDLFTFCCQTSGGGEKKRTVNSFSKGCIAAVLKWRKNCTGGGQILVIYILCNQKLQNMEVWEIAINQAAHN